MDETTDLFVGRIMSSPPICVNPSVSAEKAASIMRENDVGSLIVTTNGTINAPMEGIVTSTDIVTMVSDGVDVASVGEVMSTDLVTLTANDTVDTATREIFFNQINHLPVIDETTENPIGIVTSTDIVHFLTQNHPLRIEKNIHQSKTSHFKP